MIFLGVCGAITYILVSSKFFEGLRTLFEKKSPNFFGELINCYLCTGFWIGLFISFILNPLNYLLFGSIYVKIFFYPIFAVFSGALSSIFSYFIGNVLDLISNLVEFVERKTEQTQVNILMELGREDDSETKGGE